MRSVGDRPVTVAEGVPSSREGAETALSARDDRHTGDERSVRPILARLRAGTFGAGTNLRGVLAGASWTYLLPSLEIGRVVVMGLPGPASMRTLARLARSVELRVGTRREAVRAAALIERGTWSHVSVVVAAEPPAGPGARRRSTRDGDASGAALAGSGARIPIDLAVVPKRDRGMGLSDALAMIGQDLAPTGRAFVELEDPAAARSPVLEEVIAAAGLRIELRLAAFPSTGEIVAAVPDGHPAIERDLLRRGLIGARGRGQQRRGLGQILGRLAEATSTLRSAVVTIGPVRRRTSGRGVLLLAPAGDESATGMNRLPAYLRTLGRDAGLALDGDRWAVVSQGEYNSQKPVLLIYPPADDRPEAVIKMTRDPVFDARLVVERDALLGLEALRWRTADLPRVLFHGRHAGLGFLAETALRGRPFNQIARPGQPDPAFDASLEFLIELARSTSRPARGADHAAALGPLVHRFLELWPLKADATARLRHDLDVIGAQPALETVFLHGDAGTWNLLVDDAGRIGVLDWEAAEGQGPPMWDVARFVHSYALLDRGLGRLGGASFRARRHLIDGSSLTPAIAAAVERYRAALGLPVELVPPLLRMAWVGRAIKEASRLPVADLERVHHARLVRLTLERPARVAWRAISAEVVPDPGDRRYPGPTDGAPKRS